MRREARAAQASRIGRRSTGQHGLRALARKESPRADLLERDNESFVKWIPFMVPLLALGMALGAYLIIWGVF